MTVRQKQEDQEEKLRKDVQDLFNSKYSMYFKLFKNKGVN